MRPPKQGGTNQDAHSTFGARPVAPLLSHSPKVVTLSQDSPHSLPLPLPLAPHRPQVNLNLMVEVQYTRRQESDPWAITRVRKVVRMPDHVSVMDNLADAPHLLKEIRSSNCLLFLGAGFSFPAKVMSVCLYCLTSIYPTHPSEVWFLILVSIRLTGMAPRTVPKYTARETLCTVPVYCHCSTL